MAVHVPDLVFVIPKPALWVEFLCIFPENTSVMVYYCRVDSDNSTLLKMNTTKLEASLGDDSFHWKRYSRAAAHGLFHDCLSVDHLVNFNEMSSDIPKYSQIWQLKTFGVGDVFGKPPFLIGKVNLGLGPSKTFGVLHQVINGRPQ